MRGKTHDGVQLWPLVKPLANKTIKSSQAPRHAPLSLLSDFVLCSLVSDNVVLLVSLLNTAAMRTKIINYQRYLNYILIYHFAVHIF